MQLPVTFWILTSRSTVDDVILELVGRPVPHFVEEVPPQDLRVRRLEHLRLQLARDDVQGARRLEYAGGGRIDEVYQGQNAHGTPSWNPGTHWDWEFS